MDPVAQTVGVIFWLVVGAVVSWRSFRVLLATRAEPAPTPGWAGIHVLGAALLMVLVQGLAVAGTRHLLEGGKPVEQLADPADHQAEPVHPRRFVAVMGAVGLANLAVVAIIVLALRAAGVSAEQLGLSLQHVDRDVWLGIVGFLAVAPPTLALQATLRWAFPNAVQQHEVEKQFASLLQMDSIERMVALGVVFFAVGVMAPVAEELIFRVLLQGWAAAALQRWFRPRGSLTTDLAAQTGSADQTALGAESVATPRSDPAEAAPNPYQTPGSPAETPASGPAALSPAALSPAAARWALIGSSLLFAAAPSTQWPDPLALFVFSCGLGFLYQRTHRWLPSVVMHAALNSFSLVMLTLALASGELK